MVDLKNVMKDFIEDESGLTAVEYAIAGGLVVGGIATAFATLGTNTTAKITCMGNAVSGATTTCSPAP